MGKEERLIASRTEIYQQKRLDGDGLHVLGTRDFNPTFLRKCRGVVLDEIVFGKVLNGCIGPEDGLSLFGIRLVAVVEEGKLVDVIGRLVVKGRNFAATLIEIVMGIGGVFPEDILSSSEGLALTSTRGGKRWRGRWVGLISCSKMALQHAKLPQEEGLALMERTSHLQH